MVSARMGKKQQGRPIEVYLIERYDAVTRDLLNCTKINCKSCMIFSKKRQLTIKICINMMCKIMSIILKVNDAILNACNNMLSTVMVSPMVYNEHGIVTPTLYVQLFIINT